MKRTITYLTADVVVFVNDYVLLIQRKNEPFQGWWALPGGFFDYEDRHIKEAAIRELKEETGLVADDLALVNVFSVRMRDPREKAGERIVSVAFWCEFDKRKTNIQPQDDAIGIGWFHLSELPKLAFDHKGIIVQAAEARRHE